jgi:hypothetical protein
LESTDTASLFTSDDNIGTIPDSLEGSGNGKSDDCCLVNDSVNGVSMKPDDNRQLMRAVAHEDIAICSDMEPPFETKSWNSGANSDWMRFPWTTIAAEINYIVR